MGGTNMAPQASMMIHTAQGIAKVCHGQRELLQRKCVNRCNVTYLYVINEFLEIIEASIMKQLG
jgi:hypothetical protein